MSQHRNQSDNRQGRTEGPNYFVATDLGSFDAAPDLQAMLERHATPVRITNQYRVYRFTR